MLILFSCILYVSSSIGDSDDSGASLSGKSPSVHFADNNFRNIAPTFPQQVPLRAFDVLGHENIRVEDFFD